VWLTGMSGAGKSTLAGLLTTMIEDCGRTVTVLDVVPEIEKTPGERNSSGKLLRKAYVAARVADHGGVAICVTISSRREDREAARDLVGAERFVEVFLDVPEEVATDRREARNRRVKLRKRVRRAGLQLARRVGIARGRGFEAPESPDLVLDSASEKPSEEARRVFDHLQERGFLTTAIPAAD
jgi:adenylylsulfate kinase-like enzyme